MPVMVGEEQQNKRANSSVFCCVFRTLWLFLDRMASC